MKRAVYFCTGDKSVPSFEHYALNEPLYTHFTSPIRRYCDLVVHRLLDHALTSSIHEPNPYTTQEVARFGEQCNDRKNLAKDAQDQSSAIYLCAYLSCLEQDPAQLSSGSQSIENVAIDDSKPGQGILAEGFVNQFGPRSFDVLVPRYGIEKRVWVEEAITAGEAIGVSSNERNTKLTIYWHRREGDSEDLDSSMDLISSMVNKLNLNRTETDTEGAESSSDREDLQATDSDVRRSQSHKRANEKPLGISTGHLDPRKTKVQVIEMFARVVVRVMVNMNQSPPTVKLLPTYPMRNQTIPETRLRKAGKTSVHVLPMGDVDAD
eukprot:jgi/Hompol1/995/HPOL_001170-RA